MFVFFFFSTQEYCSCRFLNIIQKVTKSRLHFEGMGVWIRNMFGRLLLGLHISLCSQAQLLLYRSLSHYLLLPWPSLTEGEQNWTHRADHHHQFIHQLTAQYKQLTDTPTLAQDSRLQAQGEAGL